MARPFAKDRDEKRNAILKTAARVFAEEGIARASMAQVAKACGTSKASIYYYYDSKDSLLFDILDTYLSSLRNRLLRLKTEGLTPDEQLGLFTREILLAYEGMDHEHKIQTEGIALLPPDQQTVLKGYQRDMVTLVSKVIAKTAPNVFVTDPVRLRSVTMSVFGMLNWFYMWNGGADRAARETYAKLVADLTLKGVRGL